jgi:hypothetical protein
MTTGTPFSPTPLQTSVVAPHVASLFRRLPYIGPTEYQNAPTAVSTDTLLPGGTAQQNLQALADTIMRASGWVDEICFHSADGTLAASPSTETRWVKPKGDGTLVLICKYKPILEVLALAWGSVPSQLSSMTSAPDLVIGEKTITVPATILNAPVGDFPSFPISTNNQGQVYAVWQYVNGFPHTYLTAAAAQGDTHITVAPSVPGGSVLYGVYPGTQLTIHDGISTEVIVVGSVSGTTITLQAGTSLAHAHTPPTPPDSIRISAVPWVIEQACISLTSALIKLQGTQAMVMPSMPGGMVDKQALIQSGGLEDYEAACKMLRPYTTVVL